MTVRATHNAEGKLLAVMDDTLYRISPAGVAIPIGDLPGNGRVQVAHNQISLGNEVLAVNGSAGYLWNSVTDAYGRVTDPGFPGGSSVRFVSGYFVVIEPQGRFAQSSAAAQGLEWNTLDRWTSEVSPDPLVAQGVRGNELLLLSTTSGEFFQATANAQQPFRTKQINFKNVGAAGPHVTVEADGNIWWLGGDGSFYNLNGYSPRRISKRPQEDAIKGLDWSRAFGFQWDTVIYWTFPNSLTVGFDYATGEWHRRESCGIGRWRPNTMTRWGEDWIAGDYQHKRLWTCNAEDDYYLEGATPFTTKWATGVLHDHQNPVRTPRLGLVMDTGQPETVAVAFPAQPEGPTITGTPTEGWTGTAYSFAFTVGDGTAPRVVTLREGTLPAGLTLSTAGVISGTPTAAVDATPLTVRVEDRNELWADHETTLTIAQSYEYIALLHFDGDVTDEMGATWLGASLGFGEGEFDEALLSAASHGYVYTLEDYAAEIGTGPVTFSAWIYRDSAGTNESDEFIAHWFDTGQRSFSWGALRGGGDTMRLTLSGDGTATTVINGTLPVPYDEFVHCAVTRDDEGNVTLWLNGALDATGTFSGALHSNEGLGIGWYVGANASTAGIDAEQTLWGRADDVAILAECVWTEAFTPPTTPWPDPP